MKDILAISIIVILSISDMNIEGCLFAKKKFDSISFYKSKEYDNTNVQRVLLVPFTYKTSREKIVEEVTDAFFIELQKIGSFDIVVPYKSRDMFLQQDDLWSKGIVRAETLNKAKNRFNVDAIIFGTITHYRPVEPPILGIKMSMFSAKTGKVIWSSDAIFDSSENPVIRLVKKYYKTTYREKQTLYEWRLILLSTKRYAQFVAHHVINNL